MNGIALDNLGYLEGYGATSGWLTVALTQPFNPRAVRLQGGCCEVVIGATSAKHLPTVSHVTVSALRAPHHEVDRANAFDPGARYDPLEVHIHVADRHGLISHSVPPTPPL